MHMGQAALLRFQVSDQTPAAGFFLAHTDPDSNATLYFTSTLEIRPVPEPGTMILFASGLMGLIACRRVRRHCVPRIYPTVAMQQR